MLPRSLNKRHLAVLLGLALTGWFVLPTWPFSPSIQPILRHLPEAELRHLASSLRLRDDPNFTEQELQAAQLGRALFFDLRFSDRQQVACFTCHQPARDFSDGRPTGMGLGPLARHTPSLVNVYAQHWFFWDGRADSLAAQIQGPIEAKDEHGFDRGRVAQNLWRYYRQEVEEIFGSWPPALQAILAQEAPFAARPPRPRVELPLNLAHYALSTVQSTRIQTRWIQAGANADMAPHLYFAQNIDPATDRNDPAVQRYLSLSPTEQQDLDQIFYWFSWALAQYQRGLVARQSPFDLFVDRLEAGEAPPRASFGAEFDEEAWEGFRIFAAAGCAQCHSGPILSDQQFHNIGLEQKGEQLDLGRALGLLQAKTDPFGCEGDFAPPMPSESCAERAFLRLDLYENVGAFKTPSLRNLQRTGPYMHDGRFSTLAEVLRHYNELPGEPAMGHRDESLKPLGLDATQLRQLEAFLMSLTAPVIDLHEPKSASFTKP